MPFKKSINELYEIGQPIFESLFKLNDNDLKEKLKDICKGYENVVDLLNSKSVKCIRTIHNEVPHDIRFNFYDNIEICFLGIYWKSEHGINEKIKAFDEYFKF